MRTDFAHTGRRPVRRPAICNIESNNSKMKKRFLSLWFRHLTTDWLTLRRPELKDVPFILVAPERNRIIAMGVNPVAKAQGITVGMASADAKAMVPEIQ